MKEGKKGAQGTFYYYKEGVEEWRYNAYRKRNRVEANASFQKNEPLPFPKHLIVETSSRCNLKCGFCNREVMERPQMDMRLDTFKEIVKQGVEGGIYSISMYSLGEPLLNKELPEMCKYAKYMNIPYIDVSTNGMFDLRPLLHTEVDDIIISLDGLKERHEKLRINANYDLIIHNATEFIKARDSFGKEKPTVRLQVIDFPESRSDIESIIENPPFPADIVYIKKIETFAHTLGDANVKQEEIEKRLQHRTPCPQLWFILSVNADGDICYCCHDPKRKTVLGNIKYMTLKEAWTSLTIIRQNHYNGAYTDICKGCVDYSW